MSLDQETPFHAAGRNSSVIYMACLSLLGPVGSGCDRQRRAKERRPQTTAAENYLGKLKTRLPSGFTAVAEPPFVVIGNEPPARVAEHARKVVRWATSRLRSLYFATPPRHVTEVWLFRDAESYKAHTRRLVGSPPRTPYGFYHAEKHIVAVNVAHGLGSVVHEIVHPLLEADFPDCPAWFHEGLATLYEQCGESNGRIHGYNNWRLRLLQAALRVKIVPSIQSLTSLPDEKIWRGYNITQYAQARYLIYFLQEKGKLRQFYRRFRKGHRADPTGYKTLLAVLGESNPMALQARWEKFVLGLRAPDPRPSRFGQVELRP